MLRYQGILCVPDVDDLRGKVFEKAHGSRYSIHLGATKMYRDLRERYWWDGLKRTYCNLCPSIQITNK